MTMGLREMKIDCIILDVEGTTTPVDFVKSTLFSYADRKIQAFLENHQDSADLRDLEADILGTGVLPENYRRAIGRGDGKERLQALSDAFRYLIAVDSKAQVLKEIEGRIWHDGYSSGELRGQVYSDVPAALRIWKNAGISVYIYSSGSVLSQRLLFSSVPEGDLTAYIDGYFDTAVGGKKDPASYRKISTTISVAPEHILFISDSEEEVEAAVEAGMRGILIIRDGKMPGGGKSITVVRDLLDPYLSQ